VLEKGRAGLGIRGLSPVFHQGEHIGSVEFGMSLGQPFFDQFKAKYGVDIALYLEKENSFSPFGSTWEGEPLLAADSMYAALRGEQQISRVEHDAAHYAVLAKRIEDFSGKAVGVMTIIVDREEYLETIASARNLILGAGLLAFVIGLGIVAIVVVSITRPICQAASAMDNIAEGEGDLTQRLATEGNNELTRLSEAFNRFAAKVQTMVQEMGGSVDRLSSAAEEQSSVAEEFNRNINTISQLADNTAHGSQQAAANSTEVAQLADTLRKQANQFKV
jgi:methyl-accepting chemotaxis protein